MLLTLDEALLLGAKEVHVYPDILTQAFAQELPLPVGLKVLHENQGWSRVIDSHPESGQVKCTSNFVDVWVSVSRLYIVRGNVHGHTVTTTIEE